MPPLHFSKSGHAARQRARHGRAYPAASAFIPSAAKSQAV